MNCQKGSAAPRFLSLCGYSDETFFLVFNILITALFLLPTTNFLLILFLITELLRSKASLHFLSHKLHIAGN